jgi:hypothetical protein
MSLPPSTADNSANGNNNRQTPTTTTTTTTTTTATTTTNLNYNDKLQLQQPTFNKPAVTQSISNHPKINKIQQKEPPTSRHIESGKRRQLKKDLAKKITKSKHAAPLSAASAELLFSSILITRATIRFSVVRIAAPCIPTVTATLVK